MHGGLDIVFGTLIGSMAAGLLAHIFTRNFGAPPAAFAFPGVVAMVPGSYAFRAVKPGRSSRRNDVAGDLNRSAHRLHRRRASNATGIAAKRPTGPEHFVDISCEQPQDYPALTSLPRTSRPEVLLEEMQKDRRSS